MVAEFSDTTTSLPNLAAKIVTGNLVLRKPVMEDAHALAELANDRTVAEMTTRIPYPYGLSDAVNFLKDTITGDEQGHLRYAITSKLTGEFMGMVAVDLVSGRLVLGYWLGKPYRRRGFMTEAASALVKAIFDTGEVDEISSSARMINDVSRTILENLGFKSIGVGLIRSAALKGSVPVTHFRLDRRDFRPR